MDKFQAAKDAVAEASSAAAGAAMENAEKVYASSSRIALDIELDVSDGNDRRIGMNSDLCVNYKLFFPSRRQKF